ncbi:unnamed protein product [Didymodactylos carnosus]|uniref:Uncharacterized protein n=1 Tax=Didymodactylos carnosus TaxID=1234261 RepID=A0A815Z2Y7_9BILA|nr:unnamed protein product [Didymodactylos carnosus]CAF1578116.1 unnamed protein product [Didymodactylos carnosus]CAF4273808.1 unnamed protein product [Didymodactylos carnosus]CAF4444530.1 unnamed protein product [Didymodactylos carnosus]
MQYRYRSSLNEWKKRSVDAVVLSFHRLLAHFLTDIRRSCAGLGKYHLKSMATRYALDTDDIEDEPKISMNDIAKESQTDLYLINDDNANNSSILPNNDTDVTIDTEAASNLIDENAATSLPFHSPPTKSSVTIDSTKPNVPLKSTRRILAE